MAPKRKALVYTTIALLLFSIIVVLATVQGRYLNAGEGEAISKISSDSIRSFVATVERDYDKALDVSSRRAIVTAVNYVLNATPLPSAEANLEELIMNGTLLGTPYPLMENSTVSYWLSRMQEVGGRAGLSVALEFTNFSLEEETPFALTVRTTISLNVSNAQTSAQVSRIIRKNFTVSIENFTDPYYSVRTLGLVTRTIRSGPSFPATAFLSGGNYSAGSYAKGFAKNVSSNPDAQALSNKSGTILIVANPGTINATLAPLFAGIVAESNGTSSASTYVSGASGARSSIPDGTLLYIDAASKAVWNRTHLDLLEILIASGEYVPGDGPSFLDRLELRDNKTRANGLESIANLPELSEKGLLAYSNTTTVDYLYFQNGSVAGSGIRGIYYTWFKLDSAHLSQYGVKSGNYSLSN